MSATTKAHKITVAETNYRTIVEKALAAFDFGIWGYVALVACKLFA